MILNSILLFGLGFWLGFLYLKFSLKLSDKKDKLKKILDVNKQFTEVLEKVKTKKSRFKTRINNAVYIGVKLTDYGRVDLVYFLDKKDIMIYKEENCILNSNSASNELIKEITENIYRVHKHRIEDIVEVLGFVFYREDFERNFGVNMKEIKEKANNIIKSINDSQSEIENIIKKNDTKFDIDELLDKINKVGIDNLTKEEKDFLNNYNK